MTAPEQSFSSTVSPIPTTGVLLVHGLNGSRHDMEELADFLSTRGIVAENMLLPGHGVRMREMFPVGWADWSEAVQRELRALKQRCNQVFLVGHSLGGALALHVAAHEEVAEWSLCALHRVCTR